MGGGGDFFKEYILCAFNLDVIAFAIPSKSPRCFDFSSTPIVTGTARKENEWKKKSKRFQWEKLKGKKVQTKIKMKEQKKSAIEPR